MSIKIGNYCAEGPFGSTKYLRARPGVYVILGWDGLSSYWEVVDVGESEDIRERLSYHRRAPCWHRRGYEMLSVAAIYQDAHKRKLVERKLREKYGPPCGLI